MNTFWILKKTDSQKFPYRVTIVRGAEVLLDLMAQDRWPGAKGNIFCLQANGQSGSDGADETELERVGVVIYGVFGKRINVVLDRSQNKRCSFLFLVRAYKKQEGEYEQVFWQTQQGLTERRPKFKLSYNRAGDLCVCVDCAERYAWNFPGVQTVRENLPAGDYAIKDEYGAVAVVERKTMSNLLAEFGNLKKFHQHLTELDSYRFSALVIEAGYHDFLDPKKSKYYTPAFNAKAIAEIQADHPNLSVVFAGSRKAAIIWAHNFFLTVQAKSRDRSPDHLKSSSASYGGASMAADAPGSELRRLIFDQMPKSFSTTLLKRNVPKHYHAGIRRALDELKKEGRLESEKQGRNLVWIKK